MDVLATASTFFPPPRYMTLPAVGIDISDSSVKYVLFSRTHHRGELSISKWGELPLPTGIVVDGSVVHGLELSKVLAEVRKKTHTSYARVALPEEHAYIFETNIKANTPLAEVQGHIEFKLEENVPLSPRDAFFDYELVKGDDALRAVVTVYAREHVHAYYDAIRAAGITPLSFEVEAQALARAVAPEERPEACMIVDFGKTRTGIGITYDSTLVYTSTLDAGGDELSAAMRTVLGDVAEEKLTALKNEHGLRNTYKKAGVRDALIEISEKIVEELETQIFYWNSRRIDGADKRREIDEIMLCGGSANLAGFSELLAERLGVPVHKADVWRNAALSRTEVPPIDKRHSYGYATAVGLALAGFQYLHV